jgi:hypothetical protein
VAIAVFAIVKITRIPKVQLKIPRIMFNSATIIIAHFTGSAIKFHIVLLAQQDQLSLIMRRFYISYSSTVQLK